MGFRRDGEMPDGDSARATEARAKEEGESFFTQGGGVSSLCRGDSGKKRLGKNLMKKVLREERQE